MTRTKRFVLRFLCRADQRVEHRFSLLCDLCDYLVDRWVFWQPGPDGEYDYYYRRPKA